MKEPRLEKPTRKGHRRIFLAMLFIATVALIAAACSGPTPTSPPATKPPASQPTAVPATAVPAKADTPVPGGTLILGFSRDLPTFDPPVPNSDYLNRILN
ncbi:MAG: hypothetical protein Q8O07_07655, partial [Chloroflexota bacterium]|nr:hypothetical protein [Chloroflexota bacterium]